MKIPELLAPAGSYEGLVSAVQSGADAVYLGLTQFSARKNAANFSLDELERGIFYAHLRDAKVYVALNTLVTDSELPSVVDLAVEADRLGVDAFLFQDIGLATVLRGRLNADFHASTQMTVWNKEGAEVLSKLGFKRVVTARELSVEEIKKICDLGVCEVEVFCHGALCMSYSGQCMMSSFSSADGSHERSGNRGTCAQPCRLPYSLIWENEDKTKKVISNRGYRLSPADLCSLPYLSSLVSAGVSSLKIEGRLKRPEYAALVTSKYRRALDEIKDGIETFVADPDDIYDLSTQFSRGGFSAGHQLGKMPLSSITFNSPGHWGAFCGTVAELPQKTNSPVPVYNIRVKLTGKISKGDSVIFGARSANSDTTSGNINVIISKGMRVDSAFAGEDVTLTVSGDLSRVLRGAKVFRTQDGPLTEALSKLTNEDNYVKKVPVSAYFRAKQGEKAVLTFKDRFGRESSSSSKIDAVKSSGSVFLTSESLKKQIEKLGNTPFYISSFSSDIGEGLFLPVSVINEMRRACCDGLIKLKGARAKL